MKKGKVGFPSFPSPLFHFFGSRSDSHAAKTKIPFLSLVLLRNKTEMLATQAKRKLEFQLGSELCKRLHFLERPPY